ncbi:hypothetical protein AVEN_116424-1 [Araneus ventricosus]|uniref:Uncharacterized protein n=1 Tax=Araneus ventricosus TaxID=182803 RepID=A0A4Y2KJL3_ARAVE|nr:hypothetical protein AVEN_116424-1 [Araneus ventricosus]
MFENKVPFSVILFVGLLSPYTHRTIIVVVVVSCPSGPRLDQVHDTMSLQQLHKSFALLTPQLPRRGANAVNDMGRRNRTGTRARRNSLFLIDEF